MSILEIANRIIHNKVIQSNHGNDCQYKSLYTWTQTWKIRKCDTEWLKVYNYPNKDLSRAIMAITPSTNLWTKCNFFATNLVIIILDPFEGERLRFGLSYLMFKLVYDQPPANVLFSECLHIVKFGFRILVTVFRVWMLSYCDIRMSILDICDQIQTCFFIVEFVFRMFVTVGGGCDISFLINCDICVYILSCLGYLWPLD